MRRLDILPTLLVAAAIAPFPARGQGPQGWPPSPWCYEDVSRDGCRWFVLTELRGFYALSGMTHQVTYLAYDSTWYSYRHTVGHLAGGGDFGIMSNRGDWALGSSVSALWSGDQNPSASLLLRARRWVGPKTAVDFALGPRLSSSASWVGEVWYEAADVVAVGVRLDTGGGRQRLAVGLRFGSYGGVIGGVLALGSAPFALGK